MSGLEGALLVAGFAAALGLAIGSFVNVVVYRVPIGMSIVTPVSACPGCGAPIEPRDNIPLISWVLLRGKCRHCAKPISVRYLAVEALTGVLFVAVALRFVPPLLESGSVASGIAHALELVAFLYLAAISVALAAIDLDVNRLPNVIVLPAYLVGLALFSAVALISGDAVPLAVGAAGAGILVVFYLTLALLKPGGMGMGDVKLAGVLGLFLGHLGWPHLAVGAMAAFLLGGVFGVALLATRRARQGSAIPFGPWMLAGAWVGIFAGDQVAQWYIGIVGLT